MNTLGSSSVETTTKLVRAKNTSNHLFEICNPRVCKKTNTMMIYDDVVYDFKIKKYEKDFESLLVE